MTSKKKVDVQAVFLIPQGPIHILVDQAIKTRPIVNVYSLRTGKWPIEIVDLPKVIF